MTTRPAFLGAAASARTLIARREVAQRWDGASALAEMTVGDLAGHLARGIFTVEDYLGAPLPSSAPDPETELVDAATYFVRAALTPDIGDAINTGIRERARAEAAEGHDHLVMRVDDAIERITATLSTEPVDRRVAVRGGTLMLLDDYLVARLVEIVTHVDDLAASVGVDAPPLPGDATALAIDCLVGMARLRHGDLAVVRALTRRERADPEVLHAF